MAEVAGYSLSVLEAEKAELRKDVVAFTTAYDIIRRRLLESSEETPERAADLERWSGTWACVGSLELASQTIERRILDLDELIQKIVSGELKNFDTPKEGLRIVREDEV